MVTCIPAAAGVPVTPTAASLLRAGRRSKGLPVQLPNRLGGYPHRLRVIGRLFEAEDESQAWPGLHDAIRTAHRVYQQMGTMPDFAALADLAARCRPSVLRSLGGTKEGLPGSSGEV
jgi:hypothetical protein